MAPACKMYLMHLSYYLVYVAARTHVYLCEHMYGGVRVEVRGQLQVKWVLSFHHRGSRDQTQVCRFGGKLLYPLSHLVGPSSALYI